MKRCSVKIIHNIRESDISYYGVINPLIIMRSFVSFRGSIVVRGSFQQEEELLRN
jgi:hypothetical protein